MFRDADPIESQFVGQAELFLRSAHGFADRFTVAQDWRHRPGRCRGVSRIRNRIQKADLHSCALSSSNFRDCLESWGMVSLRAQRSNLCFSGHHKCPRIKLKDHLVVRQKSFRTDPKSVPCCRGTWQTGQHVSLRGATATKQSLQKTKIASLRSQGQGLSGYHTCPRTYLKDHLDSFLHLQVKAEGLSQT